MTKASDVFSPHIKDVIQVFGHEQDNIYTKGEYFGYFVNRLCKHFCESPSFSGNSFNSANFKEDRKKILSQSADKIASMLDRSDAISSSKNLHHCIKEVLWGFPDFGALNYGTMAYLGGILQILLTSIQGISDFPSGGSPRDIVLLKRRCTIVTGVLRDVMYEFDAIAKDD